jgi:hypothetical protein
MRKQVYLDSRAALVQSDGSLCFVLREAITTPSPEYNFEVQLLDLRLPLTNWTIHEKNNVLELWYVIPQVPVETSIVTLQSGNWSIDSIVAHLNPLLEHGYQVAYSENTNSLTFSSATQSAVLMVGYATTCGTILGLEAGLESSGYVLEGSGIDLSGTSCFFFTTSMRTTGNIGNESVFAKIPITGSPNTVQTFSGSGRVEVTDNTIDRLVVSIVDDDMVPVVWHGGYWSATLIFETLEIVPLKMQLDYRTYIQERNSQAGALDEPPAPAPHAQRADGGPR